MYQTHLLDLEKKEIEDNHESLVLLIMMVFLEYNDLKENSTGTHHLACQLGCPGRSGTSGKDSEVGQPGVPSVKGQKVKLLDWINLKVASNLFIRRCKIVAIKISIIMVSTMHPMIR